MLYFKRTIIQGLSVFFFLISLLVCSSSFAFFKKPKWITGSQDDITFWSQMSRDFAIESASNNPDVQRHIRWYQQHPKFLNHILIKAEPFIHYVYQQTQRYNLPAELALIPLLESQYNPAIGAPSGAAGLWQMMPGTATKFGLKINHTYDGRRDVHASTQAALTYLSYLHNYFNHNWLLALAAYDAGEGRVATAASRASYNFWNLPLSKETREYVPRLLAIATIIRHPEAYNVSLPNITMQSNLQELTWKEARSFNMERAAREIGVDNAVLRHYNPGIRQNIPNIPGSLTLLVPSNNLPNGSTEQNVATTSYPVENEVQIEAPQKTVENSTEKLPEPIQTHKSKKHKKTTTKTVKKKSSSYALKSGDNLESVAKKLHVPVKKLKQLNHIKNVKQLQIGQKLSIPAH